MLEHGAMLAIVISLNVNFILKIIKMEVKLEEDIEIWKFIEGSDNKYKVSNLGRIWNNLKNKECNYYINTAGYHNCSVIYLGKRKSMGVHRLVGLHFLENPENKPTVNHKIADKSDNTISNLEWSTYAEQMEHVSENRLHPKAKWCCLLDSGDNIINTYKSVLVAKRCFDNLNYSDILDCCKGMINKTKDYKFRFYNIDTKDWVKTEYDNGKQSKGSYRKKIYCDYNGKTYNTQMEVSIDLNIAQSVISRILLGKDEKNKYGIRYL